MVRCGDGSDDLRGAVVAVPLQGEIWWAQAEDKRRPVLIVTRTEAVPVLTTIIVAPITRSVREIPTHLRVGADEGLDIESAAAFDNLQPINRRFLSRRVGTLAPGRRIELCRALRALADC